MLLYTQNVSASDPFLPFEVCSASAMANANEIRISSAGIGGKFQPFVIGKSENFSPTYVEAMGKIGYLGAGVSMTYQPNPSLAAESLAKHCIASINDLAERVRAGQPHPRAGDLDALAARALASQRMENRSVAQWAKDLTNSIFGG